MKPRREGTTTAASTIGTTIGSALPTPTNAVYSEVAASISARKRTINRRKRIKPKEGSFRPGSGATSRVARVITFIIPVLDNLGTDDEFEALRVAGSEVSEHSEKVAVVGMAVADREFRLKLQMRNSDGGDDDQLLSDVFRELQPFYQTSAIFQAAAGVPRWEYTIGDFVADKGSF